MKTTLSEDKKKKKKKTGWDWWHIHITKEKASELKARAT